MKQQDSVFRINQEGYAAGLPVRAAALTSGPVRLKDAAGNSVITFSPEEPREDPASGDRVRILDLGVLPEGAYMLESPEGRRRSPG